MSKRFWRACGLISLWLAVAAVVQANDGQAQDLRPSASDDTIGDDAQSYSKAKARTEEHVRAGRFKEALPDAEATVRFSMSHSGADSLTTAVALHNLGFVMRRAGRADEARGHLEKALAIYERTLPAIHPDIRNVIVELGPSYMQAGHGQRLADLYAELITRAEREGDGEHVGKAHLLGNLGLILRALKKGDESHAALTSALAIYEARGDIGGLPYLQTLEAVMDRLEQLRRPEEAEARAKSALALLEQRASDGAVNAVAIYDRISRSALDAGRAADARAYADASIALLSKGNVPLHAGRADPRIAAFNNLARASRALADHTAAEDAYRRAIALLRDKGDVANEGIVTDNLAVLFLSVGRHEEAERLNKRALSLLENSLGRDHPSVGRAAGNLGALLNEAGRSKEAEPLLRRALAIANAQPKPDAVQIGIIEDNLAGLLRQSGRNSEAHTRYQRALRLFESALPEKHPRLAIVRNNIGRFLFDTGKYPEAQETLSAALSLFEAIYGRDSFNIAVPAANLAEVYTALGRYSDARQLFQRALTALERVYGPRHVNLLVTLNAAGVLELADGKFGAAREYFERAVAAVVEARNRSGLRDSGGSSVEGKRAFHGLIEAYWREDPASTRNALKALEVAQLDSMTPAAAALAALGARAGAADPALGALTRERQDLAAEWIATDKTLTLMLSGSTARVAGKEELIRARLGAIDQRLAVIDAEIALRFSRYYELARPAPLSADALNRLIAPGEVAIQFTVARDATYVFAMTDGRVHWFRAAITERELADLVRNLRCGLDRAEWLGTGAARCARLVGLDASMPPGEREPLPFDVGRAHGLYRILFQPLGEIIAGKDLVVVASGPLTSLPLQVLITELPTAEANLPTDSQGRRLIDATSRLDRVAWLGRRHATTVLPSLASLAPLRQLTRASSGRVPYIGIGNPLLVGPDGTDRSAFDVPICRMTSDLVADARTSITAPPAMQTAVRMSLPPTTLRTTHGSTEGLRRQWPLPETAEELCRVAAHVRATPADVVVGADATEAAIKSMSTDGRLADARIVHFATHGLVAGETAMFIADKAEPSLLMTPPATANEVDDGLLTASEVAGLRLDADWVVLSACNTASGDEVGAEALSGLARAFFYAGARSLLVSHWAVNSGAAVQLVTGAFDAMAREPGMSQARALSMAMASLIDSGGPNAHPSIWAPFVVVGGNSPASLSATTQAQPAAPATTAPPQGRPKSSATSVRKQRPGTPTTTGGNWRDGAFRN